METTGPNRWVYALALASGLVAAFGDVGVIRWIRAGSVPSLAAGVVFWNLSLVALIAMLRMTSIGRAIIVFSTVNGLVALVFARYYFGESFTALKIFGAGIALLGLALMEWS